jgi:hypothetical protein
MLSPHNYIRVLIVFLLLTVTSALSAAAETFIIQVNANGVPVSGVTITGNQGVTSLASRFTNNLGQWSVDTTQLISSDFSIGFSHANRALRFIPAEISPSLSTCPGKICNIEAFEDGRPSGIIEWRVVDSNNNAVAGIPINVPGSNVPCPKYTDAQGRVFFSVQKQPTTCDDGDSNQENNFYKVNHLQMPGKSCTYTTGPKKFNACVNANNASGITVANCTNVSNIAVGTNVEYEIDVLAENGSTIPDTKFYGLPALESLTTDGYGKFKFSTNQAGIAPNSRFTLVPYGNNYNFMPAQLTISPNSCPNNICKITAYYNGSSQAVVRWRVLDSLGIAAGGVEVSVKDPYSCPTSEPVVSNVNGYVYFPTKTRTSCDAADTTVFNDPFRLNAVRSGCSFTHSSQTPFQICPTQLLSDAQINMSCGSSAPEQFLISGKIYNRDGFPLSGAKIFNNGFEVGTSTQSGDYTLMVDSGSSPNLSSKYQNYVFDPAALEINKVTKDFERINFYAVAPDHLFAAPPPAASCPTKNQYEISGFVIDEDGRPMPGVTIYNDYSEVATTNSQGIYSFMAQPGEELWVRAEFYDGFLSDGTDFDPAAVALPDNYCDRENINFHAIAVPSHFIYGKVTDSSGQVMLPGAEVVLEYGGITRKTLTDSDGQYAHTVPDGEEFTVTASLSGHTFSPLMYSKNAIYSYFNLDFKSNISLLPTPTPSFTPTPTLTASITPTASITFTATPTSTSTNTFTPSNTATASATATFTFTPSSTPSPTITFRGVIRTPTATSTSTATLTASSTPTVTSTSTTTNTFTPSRTSTSTATATITQTASNTPSATKTQEPSRTATPTKTYTPSNTATVTKTPTATNTASATFTPNLKPSLKSLCSENPAEVLKWAVYNPNSFQISVGWDIYGTNQKGTLLVGPSSEATFETKRVTSITNSARLFYNGAQVDILSSLLIACQQPTIAPTNTPEEGKVTICHIPPGNPENAHTLEVGASAVSAHLAHGDYLGECRDGTPIPIFTATVTPDEGKKVIICHIPQAHPENAHTIEVSENAVDEHLAHGDYLGECRNVTPRPSATPTATTLYRLSGTLRGKNGRNLSATEKKRFGGMNIAIVVKQMSGEKKTYTYQLNGAYQYEIAVEKGDYSIKLESGGVLTVTSLPKQYRMPIEKNQELLFAVRATSNALAARSN